MQDARFQNELDALRKSALAINYRVGESEKITIFSEKLATFFQTISPSVDDSNPLALQRISTYLEKIQTALTDEDYVKLADVVIFETTHCLDGLRK
ncbi:MAG: hypothetical protein AABZ14_05880 [Candidatus Margulisiibacteriota bacterium]